jgi:hypothetical protein
MIVRNFYIERSIAILGPFKAYAPLLVYANAKLSIAIAAERFKPVTRQIRKIISIRCRF